MNTRPEQCTIRNPFVHTQRHSHFLDGSGTQDLEICLSKTWKSLLLLTFLMFPKQPHCSRRQTAFVPMKLLQPEELSCRKEVSQCFLDNFLNYFVTCSESFNIIHNIVELELKTSHQKKVTCKWVVVYINWRTPIVSARMYSTDIMYHICLSEPVNCKQRPIRFTLTYL